MCSEVSQASSYSSYLELTELRDDMLPNQNPTEEAGFNNNNNKKTSHSWAGEQTQLVKSTC